MNGIGTAITGHNVIMFATAVGALMSLGAICGLAYDWWRHPTL
jgi:hypothetical protein